MFKKTLFAAALAAMSVNNVLAFDTFDSENVIEGLAGMMDGIFLTDNLSYLKGCMDGADFLVGDI